MVLGGFRSFHVLVTTKLSLQNMRGFDHAWILSPSFHRLYKERLAQ